MFITNESMQVLKAGKATVSGSYKVGQVVTFKCGDGSTQKAKCTHAFYANANLPVGEFKPVADTIFSDIQSLYLSWVNDFLSVERFAEYYGLSEEYAYKLIRIGREVHERHVDRLRVIRA